MAKEKTVEITTEVTEKIVEKVTPTETQKAVEDTVANATDTVTDALDSTLDVLGIENIALFNNKWVYAAVVFFAVLLLAYVVRMLLGLINRKVMNRTSTNLDNQIVTILQPTVFNSIVLLGTIAVASTLDFSVETQKTITKIVLSIFWIIWGVTIHRTIKTVLKHLAYSNRKQKMIKPQTIPLFSNLSLLVVFSIFFYLVLSTWGVDMTALIASAGVLGLAVGFAAKDTLSNLFSGVFILADQPYKMGDFVVLDTGERGEITHIGIRSTRMLTRDDVEVTIPNAIMGNTKIINESGGPYKKFRIRVKVGVAYGTDVDKVRNILLEVANGNFDVCKAPEARVRFRSFGASSLDFELLCWVIDPVLRGRVLDTLNEEVYKAFLANKIEIPYQKQDLYIKEMPK